MSRPACARCQRPLSLCLCALIPSLTSRTRVLLLQHPSERRHPLNTARLAALGLGNAQLEIGETFPDLPLWLADHDAWLLFPGPEAITVDLLPPAAVTKAPTAAGDSRRHLAQGALAAARQSTAGGPAQAHPAAWRALALPGAQGPGAGCAVDRGGRGRGVECAGGARRFDALLAPFEALIDGQIAAMGPETFARNHGGAEPRD